MSFSRKYAFNGGTPIKMGQHNCKYIDGTKFVNPSKNAKMMFEDFLYFFDPDLFIPILQRAYKDQHHDKHPLDAIIKTLAYFKFKRYKFVIDLHNDFISKPDLYSKLGFFEIPGYSTLCDILKNRFTNKIIDELYEEMVVITSQMLSTFGIILGKKAGIDSMPYEALRWDKEAKFHLHYKLKMYKFHRIVCFTTGLVTAKNVSSSKSYDGRYLLPLLSKSEKNGAPISELWADNHYCSNEQLAKLFVNYGIIGHFRLRKTDRFRKDASLEEVKRWYQKFWEDPEFKINAELSDMAKILVKNGKAKIVGAYIKNKMLQDYLMGPCMYIKTLRKRNIIEGNGGVQKRKKQIENAEVRGRKNVDKHLTMHLITDFIITLTRLQHGITTKLTSREGLI